MMEALTQYQLTLGYGELLYAAALCGINKIYFFDIPWKGVSDQEMNRRLTEGGLSLMERGLLQQGEKAEERVMDLGLATLIRRMLLPDWALRVQIQTLQNNQVLFVFYQSGHLLVEANAEDLTLTTYRDVNELKETIFSWAGWGPNPEISQATARPAISDCDRLVKQSFYRFKLTHPQWEKEIVYVGKGNYFWQRTDQKSGEHHYQPISIDILRSQDIL
jgi:hypothetical protein